MLNISNNSAKKNLEPGDLQSFKYVDKLRLSRTFGKWLTLIIAFVFLSLFLPWTQNIRSKGSMTSLDPAKRPQTIHSTIPGRIEKWFVSEGDRVKKGDTIVFISEVKAEYFDTLLIKRTKQKVQAKESSIESYQQKIKVNDEITSALENAQIIKTEQLQNKINQAQLALNTYEADLEAAQIAFETAESQFLRVQTLEKEGLNSTQDVEDKRNKFRSSRAKLQKAKNVIAEARNKLNNAKLDFQNVTNDFQEKISKTRSNRASAESALFDAQGKLAELRNSLSNYKKRSEFYFITAPQDAFITKAIRPGIGEIIKEGEPLVSIMPDQFKLAAEIFVDPVNLPLLKKGQQVSLIFDGWPTVVFSGWPSLTYGTFYGEVYAIDNFTDANGKYRVLVSEDPKMNKKWPDALRPGSGSQAFIFLNDVPVWYEVWRLLNGFPPDYYKSISESEQPAQSKNKKQI
jgi:multidrug resistance efflux pump